jgi:hypothetical protein
MNMKYNRSLDLLAAAMIYARAGKVEQAAKAFSAAANCQSMQAALKVIEASNKAAYASAKPVKASDAGIPSENPGEEFREDVPENGDRVVQEATTAASLRAQARKLTQQAAAIEAAGEDDAELSFLDADDNTAADMDGDLDMDDEDDFGAEASFIKAFGARASGTAPKTATAATKPAAPAVASKVNAGAFARAVKNLNVLKS